MTIGLSHYLAVAAILFFIPIFVAFVFWDWKGGLIAAALATVGYILLRRPAIEAVGALDMILSHRS